MTTTIPRPEAPQALVGHARLLDAVTGLFARRGLPMARARTAAEALCHGDLAGFPSHGLFNLERLYLPLLDSGRCDPRAEPVTVNDLGACAVVDHRRALGLWAAAEAMDDAVNRARSHGIGLVSVRGGTHFGCAGFHAARAAAAGMVGVVAANCGGQRLVPAPGGGLPLLGTNPLSVAAPALPGRPYVLDMSTTVVPTGRLRLAEREGAQVPEGWLEDGRGASVTDPGAYDRGEARLRWLGGESGTGAYKGFGLGLAVEVLAAGLSGSATGPAPEALAGDGAAQGVDDGVGFLMLAVDAGRLRPGGDFTEAMRDLFGTVADCPPAPGADGEARYPGWWEAERAAHRRREGVPLPTGLYEELTTLGLFDSNATTGHPTTGHATAGSATGEEAR
ncbi:Ldh family oxidoreductase [Streptomyces sp. NBC_01012]|uniref:Ldh family oxidoreductase n=1 Tax=Streptomyces sp. NBC_01012 TaxID=2903717 RepID=UPI003864EE67|nr:Ldh family oxidoreductase [Streptomyces sp. NBC_01012]